MFVQRTNDFKVESKYKNPPGLRQDLYEMRCFCGKASAPDHNRPDNIDHLNLLLSDCY